MRKENKGGKARFRVFFAEIEGDDETIRDSLNSIAAAVNKTFQQESTVVRVLPAGSDGSTRELPAAPEEDVPEGEVADDNSIRRQSSTKATSSSKSSPRKGPSYSFVKDLNLRPEGKTSLRDFFKQKNPTDQQQKLTVVLYYLHRVLEIEKVSTNHVYTGLKDIEVRVPPDINQILRNIASRKNWIDSSDSEALKMTTSGDNFVEHDLPSAAGHKDSDGQ